MIQISIVNSSEETIKEISFRLFKNREMQKLINNFLERIDLSNIYFRDVKGWFLKLSFMNLVSNFEIVKNFTIELYKVFINMQFIDEISPHNLILALQKNDYSKKIINLLSKIPSFYITSEENFVIIRCVETEIMFSLILSLMESNSNLIESDENSYIDTFQELVNQNCIDFNSPQNTLSCMNINRIPKKEKKDKNNLKNITN